MIDLTTLRAREVCRWMLFEVAAGREVKEDDVWQHITTLWHGIGTEAAERILAAAYKRAKVATVLFHREGSAS